jgi:RNA polymerase sigma-70 factor (ECF subfamily)
VETPELKRATRKAAGGDEQAAAALFDHYHPRVFRYALARLRDRADAEDIASETFARVLRDLDRFRWKGAGFEAWIFRIAANLVVDHLRRETKEPGKDIQEGEAAEPDLGPEARVLMGEQSQELHAMLHRLAPEQREVLVLRFAGGLDTHEVGRVMKKKPNAIRQLQFRALENLRSMSVSEAGMR